MVRRRKKISLLPVTRPSLIFSGESKLFFTTTQETLQNFEVEKSLISVYNTHPKFLTPDLWSQDIDSCQVRPAFLDLLDYRKFSDKKGEEERIKIKIKCSKVWPHFCHLVSVTTLLPPCELWPHICHLVRCFHTSATLWGVFTHMPPCEVLPHICQLVKCDHTSANLCLEP